MHNFQRFIFVMYDTSLLSTKNIEIISTSSTLKIACHPAGKSPQDTSARSSLTKRRGTRLAMLRKRPLKGATPDQNESLVPSRHNGTVTWTPGSLTRRRLRSARWTEKDAASLRSPFFFLLQRVHVMSKSKYPRLRNESGSTMLPGIIYDLLFRPDTPVSTLAPDTFPPLYIADGEIYILQTLLLTY